MNIQGEASVFASQSMIDFMDNIRLRQISIAERIIEQKGCDGIRCTEDNCPLNNDHNDYSCKKARSVVKQATLFIKYNSDKS